MSLLSGGKGERAMGTRVSLFFGGPGGTEGSPGPSHIPVVGVSGGRPGPHGEDVRGTEPTRVLPAGAASGPRVPSRGGFCCHFWRGQGPPLLFLLWGCDGMGPCPGMEGVGPCPRVTHCTSRGLFGDGLGPCVPSLTCRVHIPAGEGEGTEGQSVSLHGDRTRQARAGTPHVPPGDRVPAVLWGIGASGPRGQLGTPLIPVCRLSMGCARVQDTLGSKAGDL